MSEEKFLNETKTDNKYNEDGRNTKNNMSRKQLIVSGRDDVLLKLLADKMNFKFEYIDVKMMESNENVTMAGALGLQMLQRRVRHASYCPRLEQLGLRHFLISISFFLYDRKQILCLVISLSLTNECRKLNFPSLHFLIPGHF